MSKIFKALEPEHIDFIEQQKLFFVATAMKQGSINISPKGMDSFSVLSENKVIWLNLTGSGNETAAHIRALPRMTIMFCAFEGDPLILRLYGQARAYHPRDSQWQDLLKTFEVVDGARQIFELTLDMVQTSCGFGIPIMPYERDREILPDWAQKKGPDGIRAYWEDRNTKTIDGYETGILG